MCTHVSGFLRARKLARWQTLHPRPVNSTTHRSELGTSLNGRNKPQRRVATPSERRMPWQTEQASSIGYECFCGAQGWSRQNDETTMRSKGGERRGGMARAAARIDRFFRAARSPDGAHRQPAHQDKRGKEGGTKQSTTVLWLEACRERSHHDYDSRVWG